MHKWNMYSDSSQGHEKYKHYTLLLYTLYNVILNESLLEINFYFQFWFLFLTVQLQDKSKRFY